ncbi:MAG: TrbC/VirB2 family protein [Elusimicrobiota bacterium]|nr:TrbC/VirB2 family protein [Endomicrobiia bacterium]MCX7642172.1 TrbC/VirB2 family protein [Elusimicrobiales bacterium]MDW8165690.1 TrbC/VirB2 family protein [Elusimicrobiota bacterium]
MIKKISLVIPMLIIFCVCFSFVQYTDTSGIGSALQNVINWLTKGLGAALVVIGMVITGIRMAMHDSDVLKKAFG